MTGRLRWVPTLKPGPTNWFVPPPRWETREELWVEDFESTCTSDWILTRSLKLLGRIVLDTKGRAVNPSLDSVYRHTPSNSQGWKRAIKPAPILEIA